MHAPPRVPFFCPAVGCINMRNRPCLTLGGREIPIPPFLTMEYRRLASPVRTRDIGPKPTANCARP